MKKIIIVAVLSLCFVMPSLAQEKDPAFYNKKGVALLPQAGDYAIGIDAVPVLTYIGGIFSDADATAPKFEGVNETIYGKYFLANDRAIRVSLDLNFGVTRFKATVKDDERAISEPTNPFPTTVDTKSVADRNVGIRVGYEIRRGKGRVQGFYGAEAAISFKKQNTTYAYGNELTIANQNPTTDAAFATPVAPGFVRNTETKGGASFGLGLGAFAGVEYFFAPQISIGGEFGFGFNMMTRGQDVRVDEGVINGKVTTYEYRARSAADEAYKFNLKSSMGGKLFVMFHF